MLKNSYSRHSLAGLFLFLAAGAIPACAAQALERQPGALPCLDNDYADTTSGLHEPASDTELFRNIKAALDSMLFFDRHTYADENLKKIFGNYTFLKSHTEANRLDVSLWSRHDTPPGRNAYAGLVSSRITFGCADAAHQTFSFSGTMSRHDKDLYFKNILEAIGPADELVDGNSMRPPMSPQEFAGKERTDAGGNKRLNYRYAKDGVHQYLSILTDEAGFIVEFQFLGKN